jgi:hypothetical protein
VVSFDLAETCVSGGPAVEYVEVSDVVDDDTVERFAVAVVKLLDDAERRADLAVAGRRRAETVLDWAPQRAAYLSVFDALTGHDSPAPADIVSDESLAETLGGPLLDVTDEAAIRAFAKSRRLPSRDEVNLEAWMLARRTQLHRTALRSASRRSREPGELAARHGSDHAEAQAEDEVRATPTRRVR